MIERNEDAIVLSGYSEAIFKATISFDKVNPFIKHCKDSIISEETTVMGIKGISIKSNPSYTKEKEDKYKQDMKNYVKERDKFVINYLKENYLDIDYVQKYIELNKIDLKELEG